MLGVSARIELDLFSIILMGWVIYRVYRDKEDRDSNIPFIRCLCCIFSVCFFDILCAVTEGQRGNFAYVAVQVVYVLYLCCIFNMSFQWFLYSTEFTRTKKIYNRDNRMSFIIPYVILLLLTVLSPFAEILFKVNPETNMIESGYLSVFLYILPYVFVGFSAVQLLVAFVYDTETKTDLSVETVVLFVSIPITALIINMLAKSFHSMAPAFSIIMIFVYFDFQVGHVSTDGLTGLNNKRQYLHYITSAMQEPKSPLKLYLIICDIDYFKDINDRFGHAEGDKALLEVSNILKKVCASLGGSFLARYGGDEFAIVFKARFADEIEEFKRQINLAVKERNEAPGVKYKLSLSIGYAKYEFGETLDTFTEHADEMLYYEKEDHHKMLKPAKGN